jgi:hypothetical protein
MALKLGLIGDWKTNGDATDSSGNGFDLTTAGTASLTTGKDGETNGAYDLDGSGDYLYHADNSAFESTNHSMSCWFYLDTMTGTNTLMGKMYTTTWTPPYVSYFIRIPNTGAIDYGINTSGTYNQFRTTSTPITTGTWYHLVATYDGSTRKIYIDGKLLESDSISATINHSNGQFRIGANLSSSEDLDGKVAKARFYNRALTEYEVQQLYIGYDTDENQVGTLNEAEMIYHFTGDLTDSSGNSRTGTTIGTPTLTTDKNSVSNQAYQFDGFGTTDAVNTNTSATDMGSKDISVSGWIKADSTNLETYVFGDWEGSNRSYVLRLYNNTLQCFVGTGSATSGNGRPSVAYTDTTNWHHFVCTYEDSSKLNSLYLDGVLVDTDTADSNRGLSTSDFAIGNVDAAGTQTKAFDGKIDEVRFYNRVLTDTEIKMLYYGYDTTASSVDMFDEDLYAFFRFDGSLTDSSGNGHTLTNSGFSYTTDSDATANYAIEKDADADVLTFANSFFLPSDNWSVSFKWQPNVTSSFHSTIIHFRQTGTYEGWGWHGGTSVGFYTRSSSAAGDSLYPTTTFVAGNWYDIVLTYENKVRKIYVNGVLDATDTATSYSAYNGSGKVLGKFASYAAPSRYDMDEMRFYERVLTADEAAELSQNFREPTLLAPEPTSPTVDNDANFFGGGL